MGENKNQTPNVELVASKASVRTISMVVSLAVGVLGIAGTFYSLVSRVAVLETRYTQVREDLDKTQIASSKYQELAQSIDARLSNLEGYLKGSNAIKN